ncbi:MAG: hypothetical protein CVU39_22140 [Chloroflexi bacterium HGW-Chloroflexi-10]|nr:MAG: hypothetical protein CVU39_22140 [Chloroflexi bacterium HGW-Chloroflexi-10]
MPTQHRKYKPQFPVLFFLSILFGLGWFVLLYGYHSLNPSEVNWIYAFGEDLFKGHIGWEWFRQEPWGFPLGRIEANGYPYGTYLFYMDSVPLLAIPLKVLSPWLGEPFQFQGIWGLLCVIGQMLAGMLILREFTHSNDPRGFIAGTFPADDVPHVHA